MYVHISVRRFQRKVPNKCHDVCPTGYRVVCGFHNGYLRTFASSCVMRMYNCKYQKDYRIISQQACEFISNEDLRKLEL
ncbi:U-Kazal-Dg21.2 [Drosophila sulfurigaster albostrigata]|uniref:U-Kazal-Dg21.2 n=1 Tax=Drosophila nasuta TaxID=42062 RepID=UPI00147173A0|nr:U-Kazal-Dg21.2 [Drosophila nasuta]XP_062125999.1 U-Kazal-Dg21.2 [Drosophila sulfurigaster albostrigata]